MVSPNSSIYQLQTIIGMTIAELMELPLPSISIQKKQWCRPSLEEVRYLYEEINIELFDDALVIPEIVLHSHFRMQFGRCDGYADVLDTGSYCVINLKDKWYSYSWLIAILAHEMCHQYQYDIDGPHRLKLGKKMIMSHGPSFFKFVPRFNSMGLPLRSICSKAAWFKYQDISKI